jgi:hypothetical protein
MAKLSIRLAFLLVVLVFIVAYIFLNYSAMHTRNGVLSSGLTAEDVQRNSKIHDQIDIQYKIDVETNNNTSVDLNIKAKSSDIGITETNLLLMDKYLTVGSDKNRADIAYSMDLLKSGRCRHIYLDLGTNIGDGQLIFFIYFFNLMFLHNVGVQIRKLYEANLFPHAHALTFFDKYFGKFDPKSRKDICTFGFEANPKWTNRLKQLESNCRFSKRLI